MQTATKQHFIEDYQFIKRPSIGEEEDSGFKAWDSDSVAIEQGMNLFRNLKSQLVNYEEKFKKLNIKTLPIKLPTLQSQTKNKKRLPEIIVQKNITQKNRTIQNEQQPLTQRKNYSLNNKKNLSKHRSIELYKKQADSQLSKQDSEKRLKQRSKKNTIEVMGLVKEQKPILITKIQQMKFSQNQPKRIRKRDIYLSIFGQRGKGKVQKLTFDDQNKPYQMYLQRKNQLVKFMASSNLPINEVREGFEEKLIKQSVDNKGKRCISQLNNRYANGVNSNLLGNGCCKKRDDYGNSHTLYPQGMRF